MLKGKAWNGCFRLCAFIFWLFWLLFFFFLLFCAGFFLFCFASIGSSFLRRIISHHFLRVGDLKSESSVERNRTSILSPHIKDDGSVRILICQVHHLFHEGLSDTSSLVISAHCNIFHEKRVTRSETYPQSLSPTNAPTYLVCMVKGQLFVGLTRILRRYWSTDHVETPKVRSTSMQASMSTGVKRRCMSSGRSNRAFLTPSCSLMFLQFFD
jgi:hypothetical protein